MNMAQRMEATSSTGLIHVSEATKSLLPKEAWKDRGEIEVGIHHWDDH